MSKDIELKDGQVRKDFLCQNDPPIYMSRSTSLVVLLLFALVTFSVSFVSGFIARNLSEILVLVIIGFLLVVFAELPFVFKGDFEKKQTSHFSFSVPLLFQLAALAPFLLASFGWMSDFPDFNYWLWPLWLGALLAGALFYILAGIAAKRKKKSAKALSRNIARISFISASVFVGGLIVYTTLIWGSYASISLFSVMHVTMSTSPSPSFTERTSPSLEEGDLEVARALAGNYKEVEIFAFTSDGQRTRHTRSLKLAYLLRPSENFVIVKSDGSTFLEGEFNATRDYPREEISQILGFGKQVLEDLAVLSDFEIYRVDALCQDGFSFALWIFKLGSDNVFIYNQFFEGLARVEVDLSGP